MGLRNKVNDREEIINESSDYTLTLQEIEFLLKVLNEAKFDNFKIVQVQPIYKLVTKLNQRRNELRNKDGI